MAQNIEVGPRPVFDDVRLQLLDAGVPEEEAVANAAVWEARYAARAERRGLGESAFDLYRKEGAEVRTGEAPETLGEDVLARAADPGATGTRIQAFEEALASVPPEGRTPEAMARMFQSEKNTGSRQLPIEIDPKTPVPPLHLNNLPARTQNEALGDLMSVRGTYTATTGQAIGISREVTKKILSGFTNVIKRRLIQNPPDIILSSAIYNGSLPDYSYGIAHIVLDGCDFTARLVIKKFPKDGSRLYHMEGFDLAPGPKEEGRQAISASVGKAQQSDPSARPASATSRSVAELVAAFKNLPPNAFSVFQPGEGAPRGAITMESNRALIELFKGRDQSTFMHESAHLWLTELIRDAEVSPAVKADLDKVLAWLGVDDASKIGRAEHEKWAQGFEKYLREGKAPSSALARAFEQFKAWLSTIYKALNNLGEPIPDDIRGVMDRMLAAEEGGPFGPVFRGFTDSPESAIAHLMEQKRGEVPDAFMHPTLGNIALVYGDEKMGLRHVEAKRGKEIVDRIPEVLRTGRVVADKQGLKRAFVVTDHDPAHVVVLRLDWDGEDKTWVVTSFDDEWGKFARQVRLSDEPPAGAPSRIPGTTGQDARNQREAYRTGSGDPRVPGPIERTDDSTVPAIAQESASGLPIGERPPAGFGGSGGAAYRYEEGNRLKSTLGAAEVAGKTPIYGSPIAFVQTSPIAATRRAAEWIGDGRLSYAKNAEGVPTAADEAIGLRGNLDDVRRLARAKYATRAKQRDLGESAEDLYRSENVEARAAEAPDQPGATRSESRPAEALSRELGRWRTGPGRLHLRRARRSTCPRRPGLSKAYRRPAGSGPRSGSASTRRSLAAAQRIGETPTEHAGRIRSVAAAIGEIERGADEAVAAGLRPNLVQFDGAPDVHYVFGDSRKGLFTLAQSAATTSLPVS